MTVQSFLDTNILLYLASKKPDDQPKKAIAKEIFQKSEFGISVQVLQEFYTVAIKKADFKLDPDSALAWIVSLEAFPCIEITAALVKNAIEISKRFRISYWDGAIIAAADALGAQILYTEDLNHGQVYGSVKVLNPFLANQPSSLHDSQTPLR